MSKVIRNDPTELWPLTSSYLLSAADPWDLTVSGAKELCASTWDFNSSMEESMSWVVVGEKRPYLGVDSSRHLPTGSLSETNCWVSIWPMEKDGAVCLSDAWHFDRGIQWFPMNQVVWLELVNQQPRFCDHKTILTAACVPCIALHCNTLNSVPSNPYLHYTYIAYTHNIYIYIIYIHQI